MSASSNTSGPHNVHGTGLLLDGIGVLLQGRSGAGKSLLALELLDEFTLSGQGTYLVADDRVIVTQENNVLFMAPPSNIAGLIELRGRGIVTRPFVQKARLDLVVDLVAEPVRMPSQDAFTSTWYGVALARCPVPERELSDSAHQRLLVKEALRVLAARGKKGLETPAPPLNSPAR